MIGILIMTVLGLILGIVLVNLESKMVSKEDEILKLLPGYNCGACGYKGCPALASAMKDDIELYKKCKLLKNNALSEMIKYAEKTLEKNN